MSKKLGKSMGMSTKRAFRLLHEMIKDASESSDAFFLYNKNCL